MQALQAQAQTSGELAATFGVSDRHVRRTIADLILEKKVIRQRDGRDFLYSLAAAVVEEDAATTTIRDSAGISDNCGHNVRDRDLGHSSNNGETISDIRGHDLGPEKTETTKQRHRKAKRTPSMCGPARIGPQFLLGSDQCTDGGTPLCPQFYAGFERDKIQFVLLDKIFRDLLITRAKDAGWEYRKARDTEHSTIWIRIPACHMSMQAGKDTVTFYSSEPGDMSAIAAWVREEFTATYSDIENLIRRIKCPENLSSEELTVVVKHTETITAIRSMIGKPSNTGSWDLKCPSQTIPGLKIYESNSTMRIEFIIGNHIQGLSGLEMRAELMGRMPVIHRTPGQFWEFIQKYYSHLSHPLNVDTGGHEYLKSMEQVTETIRDIAGQFTDSLRTIASRIPAVPTQQDLQIRELKAAIEKLENGELGEIIRTFRDLLNVDEAPTKVFLSAWAIWKGRHCKGRVNKAEIASMLLRQNEPLSIPEIANALPVLRTAGLLQEDPGIEICFSASGREIAEILMAKREGL
jgi:hypothetical protein